MISNKPEDNQDQQPNEVQPKKEEPSEQPKKNEDDKLNIYKALAIKLKKELVKSRDELQAVREANRVECKKLEEQIDNWKAQLDEGKRGSERDAITISALEARARNSDFQLEKLETDLTSLQAEYESYKVQASKIMQQNSPKQTSHIRSFDNDMFQSLKEHSEIQSKRIDSLEGQMKVCLEEKKAINSEATHLRDQLEEAGKKLKAMSNLESKCELITRENVNLKAAMKRFWSNMRGMPKEDNIEYLDNSGHMNDDGCPQERVEDVANINVVEKENICYPNDLDPANERLVDHEGLMRISPTASHKDDSKTNSSSSCDGSTSGYVHIKPMAFEIVSRSAVLEGAQNEIDNLTKAYLDSESTNSLLLDQVKALKEEIRRLQRGNERLDLAENLEYLKNVVFKYLSLDNSQIEQKQRLIPVLSTVLKLSPEETVKLSSAMLADRPGVASSFFKI